MELEEIIEKIESCISLFYENDRELLEIGREQMKRAVSEWAVSCKLSQYLFSEFTNYHVDCEYNRHIDEKKQDESGPIRPDIVIHKRRTDDHNLVYMEIKTPNRNEDREKDIEKVRTKTIKKEDGGLFGYKLGVFIDLTLKPEEKVVIYFAGGEKWDN